MKDCQSKEKFCANKIYKITYPDPWEFTSIFKKTQCTTWKIVFHCDVLRFRFSLKEETLLESLLP